MPKTDITVQRFAKLASLVRDKQVVASGMSSRDWEEVSDSIRDQAFFTAKVTHAQHVSDLKRSCLQVLNGSRKKVKNLHHSLSKEELVAVDPVTGITRGDESVLMSRDMVIHEMRQVALERGLEPTGPRTIEDIRHANRIALIVDMQTQTAYNRAYWESGNDPVVLDMWPAQELVRDEPRMKERDWVTRWLNAADVVGWEGVAENGEWIARKDSPIWVELSRFGRPYPPFDFNSGMGIRDVDRETAENLGLIREDEHIASLSFDEKATANVSSMANFDAEALIASLRQELGDSLIVNEDGTIALAG